MAEFKETIEKELDLVRQARDELKVKLHLAKTEARDEWQKLEAQWLEVQDELRNMREQSKKPLSEISGAARQLVHELRAGYERMRGKL